jgi:hypothetical protein
MNDQSQHLLTLPEAPIEVVAVVTEVVEAEAVEVDKVKEVAIKAGANIEVEDTIVELEEEVTIALVIGYYH